MADLDPDSLNKLRVVDLREHLSSRGLPTSGLKAELVNRLREALLNTPGENAEAVEQNEEQMDVDRQSGSSTDEEPSIEDDETKSKDDERDRGEEEARLQAEEEARLQAEEEERLKVQEDARTRAEDEARLRAEKEERAEEEARLRAEEEARLSAEEEARLKAEEEARLKAEEEARAEKETRLRAEEEAQRRAEEEAKAEEKAQRRAEEEAKAEEKARLRAAEEARLQAEENSRIRAAEEARLRAEEEAMSEEEAMPEEDNTRMRAEELARMRQEEEIRLQKEEEERKTKESEEEERKKADRLALEEEMRIEQERWLVEEQMRKVQEEHKRRLKEEEDRRRQAVEEARRAREEERQRKKAEEEERRKKAAEEQRRLAEERKKADEEKRRIAEEERRAKAAEKQRIAEEKAKLAAEKQAIEDEQNKLAEEEIKLPQAIEKVLALKSERAQLLGVDVEGDAKASKQSSAGVGLVSVDEDEGDEEEPVPKSKDTKAKRKRKKKKKRSDRHQFKAEEVNQFDNSSKDSGVDVDIEYVQEVINITDPMYSQFMKIFERFKLTDVEKEKEEAAAAEALKEQLAKEEGLNPLLLRKKPMDIDDDEDDSDGDNKVEEEKPKMSKRKLKKLSRMTVAELKQKVNRPELVEMHDVTAKDPVLLLHLKASRNTVPVPRHWCFKRKYLQGKRGIEKPAFELPDFIKRTGIMEMRQALQEKEDQKTMKAKMRERVRPKLGKIDIDYQKLHDAFFKWQTKPKMTIHGDLYYEGKEFETRLKEKKPGDLSEDLRTALGMPTGPNANKCPPPWLIAMQRYGPPPSYPNLKIPGLNAPIPEDCTFGYHAGGWGKPPVDETGRPLYGDVFGTQMTDNQMNIQEEEIDHTLWGELESESSEESEDEEEDEEDEDEEKQPEDESGLVTPAEGLITPSGFSSIPTGMETPDMIELRKGKIQSEIEGGDTPALYTILPEKKNERIGASMMGSTHTYDLGAGIPAGKTVKPGTSSVAPQGIEVALDPSELEMDSAAMAARYEQTMREQQSQLEKEDLSDMVAEHAARQKNKRKKQQMTSAKPPKKYKEFKF